MLDQILDRLVITIVRSAAGTLMLLRLMCIAGVIFSGNVQVIVLCILAYIFLLRAERSFDSKLGTQSLFFHR